MNRHTGFCAHLNAIRCRSKPFTKGKIQELSIDITLSRYGWIETGSAIQRNGVKSKAHIHCLHFCSTVQCCWVLCYGYYFLFLFILLLFLFPFSHWIFHFIASLQSKHPSERVVLNLHRNASRRFLITQNKRKFFVMRLLYHPNKGVLFFSKFWTFGLGFDTNSERPNEKKKPTIWNAFSQNIRDNFSICKRFQNAAFYTTKYYFFPFHHALMLVFIFNVGRNII